MERKGCEIMAKQGEAAYAYFLKGYNCSQSVVAAFAPQLGLSEEMALRMSAGFGAGIGRMREVCGAFCGVVTVLSLVYADPADPQDKSRMYALVQETARLYRARNGGDSMICRELLAKAGAAPSGGTKAEETKVSGKMTMKPSDWAASGEDETRPRRAKTQEKA